MLIIICGLPGSGKSSLSQEIMKIIPAEYLNSDVIRKQMFSNPEYSEEEKKRVYHEMAGKVRDYLDQGKNVIADATFFKKEYRQMMTEGCRKHYIIRCILPEEHVKQRIEGRTMKGGDPSDADYNVYLELKKEFEPIEGEHLEVDCSLEKEDIMKRVKEFLGVADG